MHNSSTTSLQYLALQEELSDVKERNVQLAARLQQRESDLNEARKDLEDVAKEKETLREKVTQLEEKLLMAPALSPVRKTSSSTDEKTANNATHQQSTTRGDHAKIIDKDLILKCAQRKKIKKIEEEQDTDDEGNFANSHAGPVTG